MTEKLVKIQALRFVSAAAVVVDHSLGVLTKAHILPADLAANFAVESLMLKEEAETSLVMSDQRSSIVNKWALDVIATTPRSVWGQAGRI